MSESEIMAEIRRSRRESVSKNNKFLTDGDEDIDEEVDYGAI